MVCDEAGRPVLLTGIVQDITDQKRVEEELRQSVAELELSRRALLSLVEDQKRAEAEVRRLNAELEARVRDRTAQLEEANRDLDAFAHSVSHDLRAPLRAVDGFARILVEDYGTTLDAEGQRLCRVVSDSARDMGHLIDDLLALSRVGRAALRPTDVDMGLLASQVFDGLVTQADRSRVDFRAADMPKACADAAMIRLVWQNLLSNAIKFTSKRDCAVFSQSGFGLLGLRRDRAPSSTIAPGRRSSGRDRSRRRPRTSCPSARMNVSSPRLLPVRFRSAVRPGSRGSLASTRPARPTRRISFSVWPNMRHATRFAASTRPSGSVSIDRVQAVFEEGPEAFLALAQRRFSGAALHGGAQHVRHALQKMHVLRRELPAPRRVRAEDAVRRLDIADNHAHAAHHAVLEEQWRPAEPRFRAQVVDDNRVFAQQRISRLRVDPEVNRCAPHQPLAPSDAGAQQGPGAVRQQFQHLAELDAEHLRPGARRDSSRGAMTLIASAQPPISAIAAC